MKIHSMGYFFFALRGLLMSVLLMLSFISVAQAADDGTAGEAQAADYMAEQALNEQYKDGAEVQAEIEAAANKRTGEVLKEMGGNSTSGSNSSTPSNSKLTSPGFTFDTSTINPSSNPNKFSRTGSSTQNVKNLLKTIAETLLVVVATGAVLFIVIGGFFMVTSAGDTEKANRGKIIITYNLIALALAMLSYGIMRLVVWIIG